MSFITRDDIDCFRAIIEERLGLCCADWQEERLPSLLRERIDRSHCHDAAAYLLRLALPDSMNDELGALAEQLTVGETYFFREEKQIDALIEVALPELTRRRRPGERLRILSAGCSTGEEAYTIAIAMQQYFEETLWRDASILGVDMNPAAIRRALSAQYSMWSLRATSERVRERWFTPSGNDYRLKDEIRSLVTFEERNLLIEDPTFWRPGAFDVIFCRNVTIYFSPQALRTLVAHIERALAPGGFLFLGHSESLRGISDEFDLLHTHGTFYYQQKGPALRRASERGASAAAASVMRGDAGAAAPGERDSWFDVIQWATERVEGFTRRARSNEPAVRGEPEGAAALPDGRDFARALELFKVERFAEAMNLLQQMTRASGRAAPDVELLKAVIYSNRGHVAEVERICEMAIQADGSEDHGAAAHYLLGLCREHAGDRTGAMDHYRNAIRLDSSFAMPHLHLGRLARRGGDMETARVEMRIATTLVARERSDRIVLFGGGFRRNALIELCRAELDACGESS